MQWMTRWGRQVIEMRRLAILCVALLFLGGCEQRKEPCTATFFAMDTVMEITVYGDRSLLAQAEEIVGDMERRLSVTDDGSEIAALNRGGSGSISGDTEELLIQALDLCERSGGALDISIYPLVRAWGFTTGEYRVPKMEELTRLLTVVDYRKVRLGKGEAVLPSGMEIDMGGVAKGWAGDQILDAFRKNGVKSALLNLGGNVQALGAKPDGSPWRVAVRSPSGEGYVGAVEIIDKAVITSGGYQRFFEKDGKAYHHIIDPATGGPVDNGMLSVTVVGDKGVVCDGLSTALFVMGQERAVAFWRGCGDFEAVFITEEGIFITEGLKDAFVLLDGCGDWDVTVLYHD